MRDALRKARSCGAACCNSQLKTGRPADFLTLLKLVRVLRPDFELRDYPDFEADWSRIESVSRENLNNVRTVLGADIHLPRTEELNRVSRHDRRR